MPKQSTIDDDLATSINKTRKQVTILFTDIVDSSRYWDQFGDVKGRMMVDRHNRLVFPLIHKFHGRIVKTIGDGIMAVFKRSNDALNAAIGIQQILKKMRDADRSFHAKVRIGLHNGMAIVEQRDVFGDAVNVAKRVESFGEANEIFLSEAVAQQISEKKHSFHKKGSFIPKGKRESMTVYRCRWNEYKDLTRGLKLNSDFPLDSQEKGDIVAYSCILLAIFAAMYMIYWRYVMVANAAADITLQQQLVLLNPLLLLSDTPFVAFVLLAGALSLILLLMWARTLPYVVLRLLKGVAGFGLGFALIYIPVNYYEVDFATGYAQEVTKTEKRFVRLPYQAAKLMAEDQLPKKNLYEYLELELLVPIDMQSSKQLLLLKKAQKDIPDGTEEISIAGVWRAANISSDKPSPFYFRLMDLCALCMGFMGFVSGFLNFSINPH